MKSGYIRLALIGLLGWALTTLGLRLLPVWPQPPWIVGVAVVAVLLVGLRVLTGVLVRGLPRERRPIGAVALALPGMIGDGFATARFDLVFPNAPPSAAGLFGGLMLVGYATILLGGLLAGRAPGGQRG